MNSYSTLVWAVLVFIRVSSSLSDDPFDLICGIDINPLIISLNAISASCPPGYTDYGADCIQNCKSGYSTWDQISCSANCRSGYTEIGHTCSKVSWCGDWIKYPCPDVYIRDTYMRAHQLKDFCPSGTSIFDGSCFSSCPDGYIGNGIGSCKCDDTIGLLEMGDILLNKKGSILSVGSSCITELVSSISESGLFDTGISSTQKNNPESVWLPHKNALNTFISCMDSLSIRRRMTDENGHIFSMEFGVSGMAGVAGSVSIGIVFDSPDDDKKYYASVCDGIQIDVGGSAYAALAFSKNIDSIDGPDSYTSFGADVGLGVGFSYSDDLENWAISLEIGVGLLPLNYGEGTCNTEWILN